MINWDVSFGNILTMFGFCAGGVGFVVAVRRDVAILSSRLGPIENAVERIADVMEKLGRQDERLKAVERGVERNDTRKNRREASSR